MTRAQEEEMVAPFMQARDRGFIFQGPSFRVAYAALDRALLTNRFPLALCGPRGVGKTTALYYWMSIQPEGTVTAAAVRGADLDETDVAGAILTALGVRPEAGVRSDEALRDAVEDAAFDERPAIVLVLDADDAPREVRSELEDLARPLSDGGIGLPLVLTSRGEVSLAGGDEVVLPAMTHGVAHRFFSAVLESFRGGDLRIEERASAALCDRAAGVIGRAGPLLDQAVSLCLGAGETVITPGHCSGEEVATDRSIHGFSPQEIEQALQGLTANPSTYSDRSVQPKKPFPTIKTSRVKSLSTNVANDATERLDKKIVEDLVALRRSVDGLRVSIATVRDEAQALNAALSARSERVAAAARSFATTAEELAGDQEQGGTQG